MGLCQVFRNVGEPETIEGGVNYVKDAIQHDLAIHPHLEFVAVSLNGPGQRPAMSGKTQVDAVVTGVSSCGVMDGRGLAR